MSQQQHQRRAVDSHDTSFAEDPSLSLAYSDPMLAITQHDRPSSINSTHHNYTQATLYDAKEDSVDPVHSSWPSDEKKVDIDSSVNSAAAVAATAATVGTADAAHHQDLVDDRTLEAAHYNLPEVEDDGSPPMDTSLYGYVIVLCSFIIYFIVFGTEHTFGVYQEHYTSAHAAPYLHNSSNQGIALIGTLATTFTYLLGAFSGRFADRAGYRISAVLGAVIMAAGLIGASFATSLVGLYLSQGLVLGIGSSLVYLPAVSCPAHWFERYRSIAIGIVVCGSGLGGLVLGPLTEFLIARIGVQWTLRAQGMLCLIGIGGSGLMLKTRVKKVAGQSKRMPMDFTICKEVPFLSLAMANFLTSLGYMIPFFFLSTFAVFHGQTASTGAIMIGILNGASLVGRLTLGIITDRVGRINMLFFCAFVSGLSILCVWSVASTVPIMTVFSVIYGFTCGGYFAVIPSVIADIYGLDRLTTVTGLLYGSIGLGYLIGSPVSGWLLDITQPNTNYIYVVIFSGSSMTLSSFALFYLKYWKTNGRWWIHG